MTRSPKKFARFALGGALLLSAAPAAADPYPLTYGGRMTATDGTPLSGSVNVSVAFFNAATGGTALAGGPVAIPNVLLDNGLFTVTLGLTPAQYHAIFADLTQPVWVEVTDASNNKVYPRQRYSLVPYALKVPVDQNVLTYDASGNLTLAPGAITDAAIATTANISQTKISGLAPALAGKADTTHTHILAGDVSGALAGTVVTKLQGMPISGTAPTTVGQVLKWDGNQWAPGIDQTGSGGGSAFSATAPLSYNAGTGALSLAPANASTNGYLSSTDWTIFSAKQDAITAASVLHAGQVTTSLQDGVEIKPYAAGASQTGELRFDALLGSNYLGFKAPDTVASTRIWTLPGTDGTAGQVLKTDGSGILAWVSPPAVPVASVAGKTGAVTLTTGDVAEGSNNYYTDTRTRNAVSATAPLTYNSGSGLFGLAPATGSAGGYLTAADWTAFNGKAPPLGFTPVNKAGDTMGGALSMNGNALTNLPAPAANGDAATKAYVDAGDAAIATAMLKKDGTVPLTGPWNEGAQDISNVGNLTLAAAKALGLGVASADPAGLTVLDAGKVWFNSISGQVKYWDGSVVKVVGTAISTSSTVNAGTLTSAQQDGVEVKPYAAGAGQTGELRFDALTGGNFIGFKAPDSIASNRIWTLPAIDGTNGQVLATNGGGLLSWSTPPAQSVSSVNGLTGAVTLTADSVNEGSTNQYFTSARARGNLSATAPLAYNSGTGAFSLPQGTSAANGYLLAADWTAFNGKQAPLGFTPLNKAGDTMGGTLNLGGNTLTNLAAPAAGSDAATKSYVDTTAATLLRKDGTVALTGTWNEGGQDITNIGNVTLTAAKTLGLGVYATDPAGLSALDAGKLWFNSTSGQLRYWDGASAKAVGNAITATSTLPVGTLTSSQQDGLEVKPYNSGAGQTGELRFDALTGGNYVGFKAPDAIASSRIWTLPAVDGASGQVLSTNGSSALSWTTPPPVTVSSVNGLTGAVALVSDNVTEGTTNAYFTTTRARGALTATAPLAYNSTTGTVSLAAATGSVSGYLSSTDWTAFNGKQAALGFTPLNKAGDTLGGGLNMGGNALTNLPAPAAASDAATKSYVDATAATLVKKDGTAPLTGTWNVGGQDVSNIGNLLLGSAKTLGFGTYSAAQETTLVGGLTLFDAGKSWFNTTAGQLKYWDGTTARAVRITGGGLDTLNGLAGGAQTLGIGTTGLTPSWNSTGTVHTLNIPMAAAAGVTAGLLANADWTTFNGKQGAIGTSTTVTAGTVTAAQQDGFEMKPWGASAGQTGEVHFDALIGTNYVGFKAPDSISSTRIWTLPAADGTNGQVLTTNGGGALAFTSTATPPVLSVAGRTGAVTLTSDDATEGATNLYYNNARARGAITAAAPLGYNSSTGTVSLTGTVGVANGGTGAATLTGLLVGNGTSAVTGMTAGGGLQYFRSNAGNTGFEMAALGSMAAQNANAIAVTGGTMTGITFASKGITDNATATAVVISAGGSVGIASTSPAATLDVTGSMKFNTGAQAAGKVMVSDATGNAAWQNPAYFGQMCPAGQYLQGFDGAGVKICTGLIPTFTDVGVGNGNTCGLMSDGTVQCWGYDGNGELGDLLNTSRDLPAPVFMYDGSGKLSGATAIAVGANHGCAVANSNVYCWGYNANYQLGDGTTVAKNGAVKVTGISNAVSVACGWQHSCARLADGTVKCWGYGPNGQLGNNLSTSSGVPVAVNTITSITQISAMANSTCALKSDGTLWCWGYNNQGQIGDNTVTARPAPVQITTSGFSNNISIIGAGHNYVAADYSNMCAIKTDGTVWCWGYGANGELGNNTTSSSSVPVQVLDVSLSPLTGATGIAGGGLSNCAILAGGTVKCWGYNSNGQLGDNTVTQRQTAVSVLGAAGIGTLSGITKISMGQYHSQTATAAINSNGQMFEWGYNGSGGLGDNTTTQRNTPVAVHYP